MKRKSDNSPLLRIGIPAAGAFLVLLAAVVLLTNRGTRITSVTASGISYIQSLEQKDPAQVDQVLAEQRRAALQAESESRKQELLDGTVDVWSLFGDSVILGDSRAVGFYTFEFLPHARVLAEGGNTIRDISSHIEELQSISPQTVFLCYGLNDVSIGYWNTPEEYVSEFRETLATLKEALPNTDIYVNSILPAQEVAFSLASVWRNIPEYSHAVRDMVAEEGYGWVECDDIAEQYVSLYDEDGIHVQREFYPYWAVQMMTAVYDAALRALEE